MPNIYNKKIFSFPGSPRLPTGSPTRSMEASRPQPSFSHQSSHLVNSHNTLHLNPSIVNSLFVSFSQEPSHPPILTSLVISTIQ